MENRRVLFAILASVVFTLIYMKIFPPPKPNAKAETAPAATQPAATDTQGPAAASAAPVPAPEPGRFTPTAAAEQVIPPFDSDTLHLEFSNRGGTLRAVKLKHYFTDAEARRANDPARWISMLPEVQTFGDALALVESTQRAGAVPLDQVFWETTDSALDGGGRELTFRYQCADGVKLEKRFRCSPDRYTIDVQVSASSADPDLGFAAKEYLLRAAGGISDVHRGALSTAPSGVIEMLGEHGMVDVHHYPGADLGDGGKTLTVEPPSRVAFGGCANQYFVTLLLPVTGELVRGVHVASNGVKETEKIGAELMLTLPLARDGRTASASFQFYAGPKDPAVLDAHGLEVVHPLLDEDNGSITWLRWVNKLLLLLLRAFHGFLGNWGLAIVLLTLLVRVSIFPITRVQQVSMQRYSQKMQILKPKLEELKAKYSDSPQKFAQEQMKLLREHKATPPLMGCLSSFITLPVFVGMFQLLRTAIELRQAPFFGWIHDLSLPDALFHVPGVNMNFNLLPILATAAFMLQMALAPKPADPQAAQQQKIMMFMPLVFGVMFYGYAAGLSLYMLVSSCYSIFESKVIRKRFMPPPVIPGPPAVAVKAR